MKTIGFGFLCIIIFIACASKKQPPKMRSTYNNPFKTYYIIYTSNTNKHIKYDTTVQMAENDSTAYTYGLRVYKRYLLESKLPLLTDRLNWVSFEVLDSAYNNIQDNLSKVTLRKIDSVATRYATNMVDAMYDSSGAFQIDISGKSILHLIDSSIQ